MQINPDESVSEILARNVQKLIDALGGGTQTGLSKETRVPQRTISWALSLDKSPTIGTIEALARGCKFQTWQLLVPDFDPAKPPATVARVYTDRVRKIADLLEAVPTNRLHIIESLVEDWLAASATKFPRDSDNRDSAGAG